MLKQKIMKLFQIKKQKSLDKGFTLIEILIAISIMAVISVISIVTFLEVRKSTRDSQRMHDLESLQQALEMYRSTNKAYPQTLSDDSQTNVLSHINPIPSDPSGDDRKAYVYSRISSDKFVLCAYGETNKYNLPTECSTLCSACTMGITSQ